MMNEYEQYSTYEGPIEVLHLNGANANTALFLSYCWEQKKSFEILPGM
jgi:hypothetical protein